MHKLTHLNKEGDAHMVDISSKDKTKRVAKAHVKVFLNRTAFNAIKDQSLKKGDALSTARISGIMAAKKTSDLIPLCHPLSLNSVSVELTLSEEDLSVYILSICKTEGKTGVEMEALTASSVAALTIYDMCKAIDKSIRISQLELVHKSGGQSGNYDLCQKSA